MTARKPATKPRGPRSYGRLQRALDDAARSEIRAALKETGGNVTKAASVLGVHRMSLLKRMGALGIDASTFR